MTSAAIVNITVGPGVPQARPAEGQSRRENLEKSRKRRAGVRVAARSESDPCGLCWNRGVSF